MPAAELRPPGELAALMRKEKAKGVTITVANGCFSLFHVGHVRYLRAAARLADRLVVAINSDRSISRIKGPGKMILDQEARTTILRSFEFVDYVTVFDQDTVDDLLWKIQPDFHCKGGGYSTPRQVPEYQTVKSYGGKTVIVGGEKAHSTTALIGKIRKTGG